MKNSFTLILVALSLNLFAQDLLTELDKQMPKGPEYVSATFKGTRLINGQTMETKGEGALEFIFAHRFGPVSSGAYELYGLDQAYVRLGLEYGITDRIGVGFGRNSEDKTMDLYMRYKAIRQGVNGGSPVTVTAFGIAAAKLSPRTEDATFDIQFKDRLSYTGQLLIARKFTSALSLMVMPSLVHKNTVDPLLNEKNDQVAIGVGGRIKVSRSVAITSEYYYRVAVPDGNPYYNPVGFGVDIETGGHVFQLVLTNSRGLTERAYLTETAGDFFAGDISFGFNITRTFQLKKNL